jgi:VanZ family protein
MMRARVLRILHLAGLYLFWPAVVLVVWGELAPGGGIPGVWDKLQHFVAYGGLAGMAVLAMGQRKHALRIAAALIVMGAALEVLQALVGRDASIRDEVANALGALSGAFTALYLLDFLGRPPLQSAHKPGETENR